MNSQSNTNNLCKKKKLLFLFPLPASKYLDEIEDGKIPSERLYGVIELRKKGWCVDICDSRFEGFSGWLLKKMKFNWNLIDVKTIIAFTQHDVIIVKDSFSLMATLAAKALGKKIIYLDALFYISKHNSKRLLEKLNVKLADLILVYSKNQIKLWSNEFNVSEKKFKHVPYAIDLNFYRPCKAAESNKPFVLSVGRDPGRDFDTLAESLVDTGIGLKLVTLPYLVRDIVEKYPWVEIYERLTYSELFELYAKALIVVIPLKGELTYPSGIRGVLESMKLGKPTICTRTLVLEEYLEDCKDVIFVDAGNAKQLREKILLLSKNESLRTSLTQNSLRTVNEELGMENFVEPLDKILHELT